jgi:nicotinamidase-related amidase
VALEHWCSSGFANTDLDLGYDVTMVKDATADYSDDAMHAALDVNIPNYASSVLTTSELVESLAALVANDAR